jgi:hypothetical protein
MSADPLSVSKADYDKLIEQISLPDSPVGIDAQYTHAIIIEYLRRISERLERIETRLGN